MAATRDQAARAIRPEAEAAEGDTSGHATPDHVSSGLGEQLRHHVADETRRLPADAPNPAPAARPASGAPTQLAMPAMAFAAFARMMREMRLRPATSVTEYIMQMSLGPT